MDPIVVLFDYLSVSAYCIMIDKVFRSAERTMGDNVALQRASEDVVRQ